METGGADMGKYDRPVWGGGTPLFGTGSRGFGTTWSYGGGLGHQEPGTHTEQTDRPVEGRHAGRGPKAYQRTDQSIYDEVCERLSEHGDIDASEIEVRVQSG